MFGFISKSLTVSRFIGNYTITGWPLDRENREMAGNFFVEWEFFLIFNKKRF